MVELDFTQFLNRYMPEQGRGLPSDSELRIPNMDKAALLGNRGNAVCKELVRPALFSRLGSMFILFVRPVSGRERDLRLLSSRKSFNGEEYEPYLWQRR